MLSFFRDRAFMRELLTIALPISLQQLINASLNMLDVIMVGQLGEASIAALGLSNQLFFILILLLFGMTSGMAIFTAQFWGKRDTESIQKVFGMSLLASSAIAAIFMCAAVFFPHKVLGLFTSDEEVIRIGVNYLQIVGFSYIPIAIATAYISILRSVQVIKLAVIATACALAFKTFLGWVLIFGNLNLPALGVRGAAIATASGWTLELVLILIFVYAQKTPLSGNPLNFFKFDSPFFFRVLKTALPALVNELFWSVGIATYNGIYAHISTDAIAAVGVNATMEELAFVVFMGLGHACAVMVGNRIGAGDQASAYETVRRVIIVSVLFAWLVGLLISSLRHVVVGWYELTPQGAHSVQMLMLMMSSVLWIRIFNFATFIGALRAGGDTRFALVMEICSIWLIGVPVAYTTAFVFKLPVYYVYLSVALEEVAKAFVSYWRFRSKKWMHDLVNL
ncbi:MAG: MATE family efflux transporter [Anaerolineales bacterium]|nr:MATE family efflux transporter [Anaerolineales bacterium]